MGKYVPDRDFVSEIETEQEIREQLTIYFEEIHKFEVKDNKSAGVRARNALLALYPLLKKRRKEILERKKTMAYYEHPSWEDVEDAG